MATSQVGQWVDDDPWVDDAPAESSPAVKKANSFVLDAGKALIPPLIPPGLDTVRTAGPKVESAYDQALGVYNTGVSRLLEAGKGIAPIAAAPFVSPQRAVQFGKDRLAGKVPDIVPRGTVGAIATPGMAIRATGDAIEAVDQSPITKTLGAGSARIMSGLSKIPNLASNVFALPYNAILQATGDTENQVKSPKLFQKEAKWWDEKAQQLSEGYKRWGSKGEQLPDVIARKNPKEIATYLAYKVLEEAPNQGIILAASIAGAGTPGLVYMGASSAAQAQSEGEESGASPAAITTNALINGTIEAALERTPSLMGKWSTAIEDSFGKKGKAQLVKAIGKTIASSVIQEGPVEEGGTEFLQSLASKMTGVNTNAMQGVGGRMFEASVLGGVMGAGMTAPAAIGMGVDSARLNALRRTLEGDVPPPGTPPAGPQGPIQPPPGVPPQAPIQTEGPSPVQTEGAEEGWVDVPPGPEGGPPPDFDQLSSFTQPKPSGPVTFKQEAFKGPIKLEGLEDAARGYTGQEQTRPAGPVDQEKRTRYANLARDEAHRDYNDARTRFDAWKEILGPGLVAPKVIAGQRDTLGEYNTLPIWAKNNSLVGKSVDVAAQEAVEAGLINDTQDFYDAVRKLNAPKEPSKHTESYFPEADRTMAEEATLPPERPQLTNLAYEPAPFQAEKQDDLFAAPKENVGDAYTRLVAQAQRRGLTPPQAAKWAKVRMAANQESAPAGTTAKQQEFAAPGGVQGFGTDQKGQANLFSAVAKGGTGVQTEKTDTTGQSFASPGPLLQSQEGSQRIRQSEDKTGEPRQSTSFPAPRFPLPESVTRHPDYVKVSEMAETVVEEFGPRLRVPKKPGHGKDVYLKLHDVLHAFATATKRKNFTALARLEKVFGDVPNAFMIMSHKMAMDNTQKYFDIMVKGKTNVLQVPGEAKTVGQKEAATSFSKLARANDVEGRFLMRFVDKITVGDEAAFQQAYGFSPAKAKIKGQTVPMHTKNGLTFFVDFSRFSGSDTGAHEFIHGIRQLGWFKPGEWEALEAKYGKPGQSDSMVEEAVAEGFAAYVKEPSSVPKGKIKTIFDRLAQMIRRVRAWLRGRGFRTAEDVMADIVKGRKFQVQARRGLVAAQAEKTDQTEPRPSVVSWAKEKFGDRKAPDGSSVWQNFVEWFGDSKVVDGDGKPLVVYHGSGAKGIESFDLTKYQTIQKGDWGKGIYFSPFKGIAQGYRDTAVSYTDTEADLIDKRVSAKAKEFGTSPMNKWLDLRSGKITEEQYKILNDMENEWRDALENARKSDRGEVYSVLLKIEKPFYYKYEGITAPFLSSQAKAKGADGVIIQNDSNEIEEIIVFSPTQIKSATGNVGAFDARKPSILYQAEKDEGTANIPKSIYAENRKLSKESNIPNASRVMSSIKEGAETILTPVSTVLYNINPKLRAALRMNVKNELQATQNDLKGVNAFVEGVRRMASNDYKDMDLALKNSDTAMVNRLVNKYGLQEQYKEVRRTLENVHSRMGSVGYRVGHLKDYHPRLIKDKAGFLARITDNELWPEMSILLKSKEKEAGRPLTEEERIMVINTFMRGFYDGKISLAKTTNMKQREIPVVTPELNTFYRDSMDALIRYIKESNHAIEARRFFGVGPKDLYADNLDESIGAYVTNIVRHGHIKPGDGERVRGILKDYFSPKGMHGAWALYRDLEIVSTMGNTISAMTQLQDLGFTFYRSPLQMLKAMGKSITRNSDISLDDLGLDYVAQELKDTRKTSMLVSKVLNMAGLSGLDKIMSEIYINAVLAKYKKQANAGKGEVFDRVKTAFGQERPDVIESMAKGDITDDVKFLALSELLDIQPKALSEMPQAYLRGGNARIWYVLKTFQMRQLDYFRIEVFNKMKQPGLKAKAEGIKRLLLLINALGWAGVGADWLKDFVLGRTKEFSDLVSDNLWKLTGLSKWTIYKAKQEGLGMAALRTIAPPMSIMERTGRDVRALAQGNAEKLGESIQMIPLAGKPLYWWFGPGSRKGPVSLEIDRTKKEMKKLGLSQKKAYRKLVEVERLAKNAKTKSDRDKYKQQAVVMARTLNKAIDKMKKGAK